MSEQDKTYSPVVVHDPQEVSPERVDPDESALHKQGEATRDILKQVDDSAIDGQSSLVDMWDRIAGFHDTNELVRVNIQQVQQMLQEAYEEHQRQKIDDNKRLKDLMAQAKEDVKFAKDYEMELHRVQQERKSERRAIAAMAKTVTELSKEYRSCSMQRAMFIHIALIQQFTLLITASIQRNVKNPHDLRAIVGDIQQAKRVCFPVDETR